MHKNPQSVHEIIRSCSYSLDLLYPYLSNIFLVLFLNIFLTLVLLDTVLRSSVFRI